MVINLKYVFLVHDDVINWNDFPRYWPFVRGIHRSPVNSPHKGQRRGAFMFSLISARLNGWVNNREAGDLRRIRPHYDVTVQFLTRQGGTTQMIINCYILCCSKIHIFCKMDRAHINKPTAKIKIKHYLTTCWLNTEQDFLSNYPLQSTTLVFGHLKWTHSTIKEIKLTLKHGNNRRF